MTNRTETETRLYYYETTIDGEPVVCVTDDVEDVQEFSDRPPLFVEHLQTT